MATVMLIAFTLAVAALVGSWFTSMTKTETNIIESGATEQINCSSGILDIVKITCTNDSSNNGNITIAIQNLGTIDLYDFSVVAKIGSNLYVNNTYANSSIAPNSTDPLNPGEQYILVCSCDNTECPGGAEVGTVRVSPGNCPQAYAELDPDLTCSSS